MKKLIRDKLDNVIPEEHLSFCSHDDYFPLLLAKLGEELEELALSDFKDVAEYADVMEILLAIADYNKISKDDIMSARIEKLYKNGGFKKGLLFSDKA